MLMKTKKHEKSLVNIVSTHKKSEETTYQQMLREVSGCEWTKDLRNLPSFNFIQLYDYLVKKTSKYDHSSILTSGYKKLKPYQFF